MKRFDGEKLAMRRREVCAIMSARFSGRGRAEEKKNRSERVARRSYSPFYCIPKLEKFARSD